jgi:O-antigen/teichoic acid export membrane protein
VRIYVERGPAAIVALKREVLGVMIYPIGLASAWLLVAGSDLMIALAGEAKAASAPVFVVSCLAMSWFPLFDIGGYGLLLQKRSRRYLLVMGSAGLLNVLLNIALIPVLGVMGAVVATAASYVFLTFVHLRACPAELRALPPPATFARVALAVAVAAATGWLVGLFAPDPRIARLVLVVLATGGAYAAVALALDRTLWPAIRRQLDGFVARTAAPE